MQGKYPSCFEGTVLSTCFHPRSTSKITPYAANVRLLATTGLILLVIVGAQMPSFESEMEIEMRSFLQKFHVLRKYHYYVRLLAEI